MKRLLFIAAVVALVTAKPGTYRENEDFQYSRSSSDEGTKSGYYGAQRGNMGGNYERAHNMDSLAQNQMSGVVRQVEGDLGDGYNTRTGSVYSAANSRGIYGSGKYDLSNLQGRNFQESVSSGDSQSHSSLSSQNSAYSGQSSASSQSHRSGYSQFHNSGYKSSNSDSLQSSNLQSADTGAGLYDYGRQSGYSSGYHSQAGQQSSYTNQHNSNGYGSNAQTRLIGAAPARILIRPGGTVIIPIAAQTYDSSHRSQASTFDQNAINSEAEVLSNTGQQTQYRPPSGDKHYESSYSYRKQWEKHDTEPSAVPLAVPTVSPYPRNSELHDDDQASHQSGGHREASGYESHNSQSSNLYNSNVKSASSSQSRYQSGYNSQQSSSMANSNAHSGSNSNAYTHGAVADASNLGGEVNSRPKSYQSSYSYHKSWERQGDPYVIIPDSNSISDGVTSQRLTTGSGQQHYGNQQYGSHYNQYNHRSHASSIDCDENGHIRVARAVEFYPNQQSETFESQNQEELGQQTQNGWENLEQGQETQNLNDFGQQAQSNWNSPDQNVNENLEHLGQQTQDLNDFGQQTQYNWNDRDQNVNENLEDLGQQTQNLNDFSQQAQSNWNSPNQKANENLEDLGQQTQNLEDLGQQTQNLNDFRQQSQNKWGDSEQQTQNQWNKLENFGQQTQTDLEDQTQDAANPQKLEDLSQQSQTPWDKLEDLGQAQGPWNTLENQKQQNINDDKYTGMSEQEVQSEFVSSNSSNQHPQTFLHGNNDKQATDHVHNIWDRLDNFESQNNHQRSEQHAHESQNFDNFYQQNNWHENPHTPNENFGQQTQDSWGTDILDQNRTRNVSNNDQREQLEENTQQVSENSGFEIYNNNRYGQAWNFNNNRKQTNGTSDSFEPEHITNNEINYWKTNNTIDSNRNTESSGGGSSLQGLWDKLYNLEVSSTSNKNSEVANENNDTENVNSFSHGEATSQNTYQSSWSQTYHSESNSDSEQSYYHHNSHYGQNRPWPSTNFNEDVTVKPKEDPERTHKIENLQPMDIGRGDIGPEDSLTVKITTTSEKPFKKVSLSPTYTFDSYNNQNKTAAEIEALSLTKETNTTMDTDYPYQQTQAKQDQNTEQSDNLHILSLNQQKWLSEQRQHNAYQYNESNTIVRPTTRASPTIDSNYNNAQATNKQQSESYNSSNQSGSSTLIYNKLSNRTLQQNLDKPNSDSLQKSNGKNDQHFEQSVEEIEQHNTEQQLQDFGQFGQQSVNMYQQNQNGWEQGEDLAQQSQNAWEPYESLQQESENQQLEKFERSNTGQYQTQNFYEQKHANNDRQNSQKVNNLQISPQTNQEVEDIQLIPPKHTDVEVISPSEVTTVKPGFWKSVGNKFTSAKDSVASWFRRS